MNSLQNLINHGIDESTANRMLSEYRQRVGTMSGIYKIVDISYDFNVRGRDVTLECSKCGNVIHRTMIKGRNKWSELIKSCPCQKEEERRNKQIAIENSKKTKMERILSDAKSLIGEEYGDYEIADFEFKDDIPTFTIKCRTCSYVATTHYRNVKANAKCPQKCHKHYIQPVKYDESYIGRKKNFLTVKSIIRRTNNHRAFVCECDCGNITTIEPAAWEYETVKSCGCKQRELASESSKTHGHSGDRLYRVYNSMKERCYNTNNHNYHNYGGRGIKVCEEWLTDFMNFYEWAMKSGYDYGAKHGDCTLDRINVNGNYEPSNCRWVDMATQANNKRPSSEWRKRKPDAWTIDGEAKTFGKWCKQYNTSTVAVRYRMNKLGMTLEEALKTPKMTMGRPRKEQII